MTFPSTIHQDALQPQNLAVYIHWPFCLSKCPYCDFNSYVRSDYSHTTWLHALVTDLNMYSSFLGKRRITSIFFGGGTPSLMSPNTVAALIERLDVLHCLDPSIEITLEANPSSSDIQVFKAFRSAGINRLSLGVQSFDEQALAFLGRTHSVQDAHHALTQASQIFPRFSFDLIYALPQQTVSAWEYELLYACSLTDGHLSAYQLSIEPETPFYALYHSNRLSMPDENTTLQLFDVTQNILSHYNLPAYEISNHAIVGMECRHNLTYWNYGDYVGLGPGAHSRLTLNHKKWASVNTRIPETWLKNLYCDPCQSVQWSVLSDQDCLLEILLMGLRLTSGIKYSRILQQTGKTLVQWIHQDIIEALCRGQFIDYTNTHIRATPAGKLRLNAVLATLLTGLRENG